MRYKIFTFRGYHFANSEEDALSCAISILRDIVDSFEDKTLWWVLILDTQDDLFKMGSCFDVGCISFSPWFFTSLLSYTYK